MDRNEVRYRAISALLQSGSALTLADAASQCEVAPTKALPVLRGLVEEGLVIEGRFLDGVSEPQFCWAARPHASQRR